MDQLGAPQKIGPLHWAAHKEHVEIALFLIENGADLLKLDGEGRTPLSMASPELAEKMIGKWEFRNYVFATVGHLQLNTLFLCNSHCSEIAPWPLPHECVHWCVPVCGGEGDGRLLWGEHPSSPGPATGRGLNQSHQRKYQLKPTAHGCLLWTGTHFIHVHTRTHTHETLVFLLVIHNIYPWNSSEISRHSW